MSSESWEDMDLDSFASKLRTYLEEKKLKFKDFHIEGQDLVKHECDCKQCEVEEHDADPELTISGTDGETEAEVTKYVLKFIEDKDLSLDERSDYKPYLYYRRYYSNEALKNTIEIARNEIEAYIRTNIPLADSWYLPSETIISMIHITGTANPGDLIMDDSFPSLRRYGSTEGISYRNTEFRHVIEYLEKYRIINGKPIIQLEIPFTGGD